MVHGRMLLEFLRAMDGLPVDIGPDKEIEICGVVLRYERHKGRGVRLRATTEDGSRVKPSLSGKRLSLTANAVSAQTEGHEQPVSGE